MSMIIGLSIIGVFIIMALFLGDLFLFLGFLSAWIGLFVWYRYGKDDARKRMAHGIRLAAYVIAGILFTYGVFDSTLRLHHSLTSASLISLLSLVIVWIPTWIYLFSKFKKS
ncbi:MAG: hypothetical protein J7K23_02210 [Thermoproteales archaeon]|nr:hypothetical protein [Thermoproteales archaeon]